MATGLEVNSSNNASYLNGSVAGSMEWYDASNWHNGWPGAYAAAVNPPLTGGWYITNYVWTNSLP
jgi:hypothetical protein